MQLEEDRELKSLTLAINTLNVREIAMEYWFKKGGDVPVVDCFNKALEINQQIGRKEGMALQYTNLGELEESRSNPSAARSYYEKALDLWKTLGNPGEVAALEARLTALDD